jgi:methylated-DNA-[protein]-cysteine S-methyltransferase
LKVSKGKVTTYFEIAKAVGQKWITVYRKNDEQKPFPIIIPCHRVILSTSDIEGYVLGKKIKTNMMYEEEIKIKNRKILNKYTIYRF